MSNIEQQRLSLYVEIHRDSFESFYTETVKLTNTEDFDLTMYKQIRVIHSENL